jgi:hypothetical protein
MAGLRRSVVRDLAEIERQVGEFKRDLTDRLNRLGPLARRGTRRASREAGEYVSDFAHRFRDGATSVRSLTDEAARFSGNTLRRIGDEIEQRPLLAVALVAGIALLVLGLAARRRTD